MKDAHRLFLDPREARVEELIALLEDGRRTPRPALAAEVVRGVPVYDCGALRPHLDAPAQRHRLMAEWHDVLAEGAGVLVLASAWADAAVIDAATAVFHRIAEAERATQSGADHFGAPGSNIRIWNASQKLCLAEPALFAHYHATPWLDAISTAWLGPGYQVTAQVNCVNPGGQAQRPHRDYHLGFATPEQAARWPRSVHRHSAHLTLQGAVAHVDMPLESGPTLLLPHSQKFEAGYLVQHAPAFEACFEQHHVQLPLRRGDALFFNPALIHAAGSNRSAGIRRMANLLQVSSAFGRAMESLDRVRMSRALYPALLGELAGGRLGMDEAACAIAVCADGYAFPTNLDTDPPLDGLAPPTQQAVLLQALREAWPAERVMERLSAMEAKRRP